MSVAGKIISIKKNGSRCKNQPSVLPDTIGLPVLWLPFLKKKRRLFYFSCIGIMATAPVLPEAAQMDDQISFSQAY